VRQGKISRVQRCLKKNLFLLNPIFQQSLMHIRLLCFDISETHLANLKPKHNYTLEEFILAQDEHGEEVVAKLSDFSIATVRCCVGSR
jgi:hypothetical protein